MRKLACLTSPRTVILSLRTVSRYIPTAARSPKETRPATPPRPRASRRMPPRSAVCVNSPDTRDTCPSTIGRGQAVNQRATVHMARGRDASGCQCARSRACFRSWAREAAARRGGLVGGEAKHGAYEEGNDRRADGDHLPRVTKGSGVRRACHVSPRGGRGEEGMARFTKGSGVRRRAYIKGHRRVGDGESQRGRVGVVRVHGG